MVFTLASSKKTLVRPGDLKHEGIIRTITSYTVDGQPEKSKDEFYDHFGIDNKVISENDATNNTGNKRTVNLFTHYDPRLENDQVIFIFNKLFSIGQLDNVDFANRRLNLVITEL
ncbi:MAG: hypothetical protein ACJAUY_000666 [Cognaticolwellia sp.]